MGDDWRLRFCPALFDHEKRGLVNALPVTGASVVVPDIVGALGIVIDHIVVTVAIIMCNRNNVAVTVFLDYDARYLVAGCTGIGDAIVVAVLAANAIPLAATQQDAGIAVARRAISVDYKVSGRLH